MDAALLLSRLAEMGVTPVGASVDSRAIGPGEVFLAYPGAAADGRRYIAAAAAKGAAAVLWEAQGHVWDQALTVPNLPVADLRAHAGHLADLIYGQPSAALKLFGITGTNGKTSISHWLAQAWQALGGRCAVIGTVGNGFLGELSDALNTTPDAVTLHRELARYRAAGANACAMEVSSIGLDQGRVHGALFSTAILTNLTQDHLEYHHTMAAYGRAKERLFEQPGLKHAVLNLDDAFGRQAAAKLAGSGVQRIGYSVDGAPTADVELLIQARHLRHTERGQALDILVGDAAVSLEVALIGRFNIANLLAVAGALWAEGVALADIARVLPGLKPPAGRMEMHGVSGAPLAVVDYAHTPDALEKALETLRETAQARGGRLICVFGCGGDRDGGKRPLMGAVAARLADQTIITSDNPRSENPEAIIAAVRQGAPDALVIADRAQAIRQALLTVQPQDLVLIAGKGHENYQEIAGQRLHFSDAEHAALALAAYESPES